MSLAPQLQQLSVELGNLFPPSVTETLSTGLQQFLSTFSADQTIQQGAKFPSFKLSGKDSVTVESDDLLSKGPVLLTFFRGNWCPYCNLALSELQAILPELKKADPTLQVIAVSPQLPDWIKSPEVKEGQQADEGLQIYSDEGNALAQELGLSWHLPISFDKSFKQLNMDIHTMNEQAEGQLQVPVPATFYIDQNGVVQRSFIDPDFTKRLEPQEALKWASEERRGGINGKA